MSEVLITIDHRIRIDCANVDETIVAELRKAFEHRNPEFAKREYMHLPTWGVPRVITMWHQRGNAIEIPRGGLARVCDILGDYDRHFVDNRIEGEDLAKKVPDHRVKLWAHQSVLVDAAIEKQQCILRSATGSGKTSVGFAIIAKLKLPTLVIVPSGELFKQWIRRAQTELGLKLRDVGVIKGKARRLRALTIAMQKTLSVHGVDEELQAFFGCVIVDEVQLAAAKTFVEVIDKFPAKYRIGISADHRRKDKKEFLIHDLFGAVAADVSREQLISNGVIVDTEVRVIPTDFEAPWYGKPENIATVGTGFEQFDPNGTPVSHKSDPADEKVLDWTRLLTEMSENQARNEKVLWAIEQGLAQREQVLVMSHLREHCRLIDRFLVEQGRETGFLIGGPDYKVQFDITRKAFESQKLDIAVGTFQAIGYGIDLPKAAVVVCSTPIASNRQFFSQVRGRVCRSSKGKTLSWMYYLWDRRLYGVVPVKNLLRWNQGRVVVWDHGKWIDGKTYLQDQRPDTQAMRSP